MSSNNLYYSSVNKRLKKYYKDLKLTDKNIQLDKFLNQNIQQGELNLINQNLIMEKNKELLEKFKRGPESKIETLPDIFKPEHEKPKEKTIISPEQKKKLETALPIIKEVKAAVEKKYEIEKEKKENIKMLKEETSQRAKEEELKNKLKNKLEEIISYKNHPKKKSGLSDLIKKDYEYKYIISNITQNKIRNFLKQKNLTNNKINNFIKESNLIK